jgi:chromosome condensin MukBEF ATPase and DNA-binding subunit MukB
MILIPKKSYRSSFDGDAKAMCEGDSHGHSGSCSKVDVDSNEVREVVERSRQAKAEPPSVGYAVTEDLGIEAMGSERRLATLDGVEDAGAEVRLVSDKSIGCLRMVGRLDDR